MEAGDFQKRSEWPPQDNALAIHRFLSEQEEFRDEEITQMMPAFLQLQEWQVPSPSGRDTQKLLENLFSMMPTATHIAPIRYMVKRQIQTPWQKYMSFMYIASMQVSILRPAFWIVSAVIALCGIAAGSMSALWLIGPLLAYMSTQAVFRSVQEGVMELECACPLSLPQLTLARLLIVLGYDIILGMLLSIFLWARIGGSIFLLCLHWFMPLLLVTGIILFLSLRLSVHVAAALGSIGWILFVFTTTVGFTPALLVFTIRNELLMGGIGLLLLGIAIVRIPASTVRFLPKLS